MELRLGILGQLVAVDADDDPFAGVDLLLEAKRGVGDLALRETLA